MSFLDTTTDEALIYVDPNNNLPSPKIAPENSTGEKRCLKTTS
jgi:hypothetical protein